MKKALLIAVYNLAVVILLLGLLESLIRMSIPEIRPYGTDRAILADSMYYDSMGLRPSSFGYSNGVVVEVDRFGFRRYSVPVDSLKRCWLFLGDSVTMGIGVEADSTFAGIIQSAVSSMNILNPSVIGYAAKDYRNVFRYFVVDSPPKFEIVKVTIFWCLNDLYLNRPDVETPGGVLRSLFGEPLRFLRRKSRLYLFIKNKAFDRSKAYYEFDEQLYSEDNSEFIKAINELAAINDECKERGIDFQILIIPYEYQLRNHASLKDKPQKILTSKLEEEGIKVLDPLEFFRNSSREPKRLFLYGDGIHLSNAGHRLLAQFIMRNG